MMQTTSSPSPSALALLTSSVAESNRGVELMTRGEFSPALQALTASLSHIKKSLQEAATVSSSAAETVISSQPSSSQLSTTSVEILHLPLNVSLEQHRDVSQGIHASATVIQVIPKDSSSPLGVVTNEMCNSISSIVIYNLALLHHLIGISSSITTTQRGGALTKAVRLYEHSYRLHMNDQCSVPDTLRAMSILNNLAHVNSLLNETDKADLCWQKLLSLLLYCREYGLLEEGAQEEDEASKQEGEADAQGVARQQQATWQLFTTNVSHLILQGEITAAAA